MPFPHTFITLTDDERKRISWKLQAMALKGQGRKRKRLQSIWLSNEGYTFKQISTMLNVTYQSVKMWISLYRKVGLDEYLVRMKK
ncbi:MAG: helix-turn-helix domain-containing protein [Candidatus Brocadiia bacterium]